MRKKANKERLPLLFAALLGALLLSNCGYRPEGVEAVQPLSDVPRRRGSAAGGDRRAAGEDLYRDVPCERRGND